MAVALPISTLSTPTCPSRTQVAGCSTSSIGSERKAWPNGTASPGCALGRRNANSNSEVRRTSFKLPCDGEEDGGEVVVKRGGDAASESPPESPIVHRQPLIRQRSISWSKIWGACQAKANSIGDLPEGEPQQEEQDGFAMPRRLWSGRSFGEFPFAAEPPFINAALAEVNREASFASSQPGTAPTTPRVMRLPMPGTPTPPSVQRGFRTGLETLAASTDQNDGRFVREFSEAERIGEGSFSMVFRARHNVDRCMYAVKRTKQTLKKQDMRQMQEAFVLASMALEAEACPNIVRYFSSWFEGNQLFIQMELCLSSLREHLALLVEMRPEDPRMNTKEIVDVLCCVAGGLHSMHSCGFAHLDIKPDNIMRGRGSGRWKIGDLGLAVAAISSNCDDVCEGDCRYLAREVLQGDLCSLEKGDVFSLGIMAYELARNPQPLPCSGEEWHTLRKGELGLVELSHLSVELCDTLLSLVRPDAVERPSCEDILEFCSDAGASWGPGRVGTQSSNGVESEEVSKLQKQVEELGRTAQENREMADKYKEELMRLRSRTASDSLQGKAGRPLVQRSDPPRERELIRSYSL